jgi:hypothetical protein
MNKLKLRWDDLVVSSFATAEGEPAAGAGTVRGREAAVSLDLAPCPTGGWCKSQLTYCIRTPRGEAL